MNEECGKDSGCKMVIFKVKKAELNLKCLAELIYPRNTVSSLAPFSFSPHHHYYQRCQFNALNVAAAAAYDRFLGYRQMCSNKCNNNLSPPPPGGSSPTLYRGPVLPCKRTPGFHVCH